jgi:hypothetical protein
MPPDVYHPTSTVLAPVKEDYPHSPARCDEQFASKYSLNASSLGIERNPQRRSTNMSQQASFSQSFGRESRSCRLLRSENHSRRNLGWHHKECPPAYDGVYIPLKFIGRE